MRCENKTFLQNDPGFLQEISSTAVEVGLGLSGNLRARDAGGMERAGVRDRLGRTAMPAYVSAVGFSVTQAWSRNWASRSGTAEGAKKTPRPAGRCPRSTAGPLTKSTSSSAAPAVAWGCA